MEYRNVRVEVEDRLATVTVDRPEKLNALDAATIGELTHLFLHLPPEAGAVVLTGAGEKAFIAGADIAELAGMTAVSAREVSARGQALCAAIEGARVPVIAAVNGFALGGGLEVALAAHLRLASANARLGLPEVTLGLIPGYGGTQRLPRIVGEGRALEMMLTGEMVDAEEALRIGLVNRVFPAGELLAGARRLAGRILANGPLAVRYVLSAVNSGARAGLSEGLALEGSLFGLVNATADAKEGLGAFLARRKAAFTGE